MNLDSWVLGILQTHAYAAALASYLGFCMLYATFILGSLIYTLPTSPSSVGSPACAPACVTCHHPFTYITYYRRPRKSSGDTSCTLYMRGLFTTQYVTDILPELSRCAILLNLNWCVQYRHCGDLIWEMARRLLFTPVSPDVQVRMACLVALVSGLMVMHFACDGSRPWGSFDMRALLSGHYGLLSFSDSRCLMYLYLHGIAWWESNI